MTNERTDPTLWPQRLRICALDFELKVFAGAGTQLIADSAWMLSGAGQSSIENLQSSINKESRGDVGTYSPQPVARVRPLPTCTRCFPDGQLRAIVRLGSGLTANRENRPTPRDSILLSAGSRSPQPALRCSTLADPLNPPCDQSRDPA